MPARKPNKLMADLTRAMQAAAEQARTEALSRLGSDSKAFIETIHADSATEATELRRQADDDVAAIREWSKAEIARIREETEERISGRKGHLEREIEQHAAAIERRIERVQARVAAFETEMADFFERLTAEEDPTRLAGMAESLPEPPSFDAEMDWEDIPVPAAVAVAEPVVETVAEPVVETRRRGRSVEAVAEPVVETVETEAVAETQSPTDDAHGAAPPGRPSAPAPGAPPRPRSRPTPATCSASAPTSRRASRARPIRAWPPSAWTPTSPRPRPRPPASATPRACPRTTSRSSPTTPLPLAWPAWCRTATRPATRLTTRVVVVGLVSVASIAGFKRHLSRVPGVESVGVSSGPDGEFVFAVARGKDLDLTTAITTLPGFAARVTGETDGDLQVTARDPENEG